MPAPAPPAPPTFGAGSHLGAGGTERAVRLGGGTAGGGGGAGGGAGIIFIAARKIVNNSWLQCTGGNGGSGSLGGSGGTYGGGGGGSGFQDGSVTVVNTRLGGSTGDAKVILRVVT